VSKKRLGRGLDALLSSTVATKAATNTAITAVAATDQAGVEPGGLAQLAIGDIVRGRYQPRQEFPEEGLQELAASISAQGLLQPIVVRPRPQGGYELIAGERRWRAAQIAGLSHIPASIREVGDKQASAMALIENIQREDLNPLEEATALERLKDEFQLTQQQIAEAVGKSRVAVANLLRLLNLATPVKELLAAGAIEMGHARALLSLELLDQERLANQVAARGLSVRQTEALVRRHQQPAQPSDRDVRKDNDTRRLEQQMTDKLGAPVSIEHNAQGKGQLVIRYTSLDELDGILRHFGD